MGFLQNLQTLFGKKISSQPAVSGAANPLVPAKKKVLIVEDEALLANALEAKLIHENFEVIMAANGEIGLAMIQANRPDIVLLDLMMPVMDGKTMLHKLREIPQFKFLPVVILTNAGDVENIRETKRYDNASAFLIKSSIDPDDVVKVVNDLL